MESNEVKCNISETINHLYSVSNTGQFALNYSGVTMEFAPVEQTRNWTLFSIYICIHRMRFLLPLKLINETGKVYSNSSERTLESMLSFRCLIKRHPENTAVGTSSWSGQNHFYIYTDGLFTAESTQGSGPSLLFKINSQY